ncbi:MAG TPA: methyltransferase domain-containing protein [Bryobacteraceae bacterium]|nr:methyltransferase domain-containing protein [Bryobacteraceae bacterium]
MRLDHCERLQPICPVCWLARQSISVLRVAHIARQEGPDVLEGALHCPEPLCQREHPIIDGIPVVLANPASWAENQLPYVLRREDLSPYLQSLLGDLAGPGSVFDRERGNNSIYAHAHWAPDAPAYLDLFRAARSLMPGLPNGVWLDIGCSVGRGTLELAQATGGLAVGVDLNFSMLRLAESIRRTGRARYPLRRVGLAFDFVDDPVPSLPFADASFWCSDVSCLPFAAATFDGAIAMNMLDCVPSPLGLLCELGRVVKPGESAILATPFDWAAGATQPDAWFGGHSQRSAHQGSSLAELRRILSPACDAGVDTGLSIEAEQDHVSWRLRTHERAVMEYSVYMARLRRRFA